MTGTPFQIPPPTSEPSREETMLSSAEIADMAFKQREIWHWQMREAALKREIGQLRADAQKDRVEIAGLHANEKRLIREVGEKKVVATKYESTRIDAYILAPLLAVGVALISMYPPIDGVWSTQFVFGLAAQSLATVYSMIKPFLHKNWTAIRRQLPWGEDGSGEIDSQESLSA